MSVSKETSVAKNLNIKKHHAKPFRKRHISALAISIILFGFSVIQFGILQGINRPSAPVVNATKPIRSGVTRINSSLGFSFDVDTNQFKLSATELDATGTARDVETDRLSSGAAIVSTTLRPIPGAVERIESAVQATIQISNDASQLTKAINNPANAGLSAGEVAGQLFPAPDSKDFTRITITADDDALNGTAAYRTIYEYTPTFAGGKTYAVVWSGVSNGRAFAITIRGLVGSSATPVSLQPFLASLIIASDQQVKGASIELFKQKPAEAATLDQRYVSDALSPAVVKIYHLVCGALSVQGQTLTKDACTGFTGSGFFVTSNGYIATNGHVVVYSAQDALVDILTKNPVALTAFMRGLGLTPPQIQQINSDPISLASVIAKIYDIPDERLKFENQKNLTLVAIGSIPPKFDQLSTSTDISRLQQDTRELKVAKIIGYNYVAKDKLTAISDPAKGFTASDVALVKVNVENAPTIALSNTKVVQRQNIFLIGFPGDADNQLTDNTQLGVSVTNGIISSIRQAAGKNGVLYQSDADASHGNSGGPAIDETGKAIGLLTYRASGDTTGNAAKSYIRDIGDLSELARKLNVRIDSTSSTQQAWQTGLDEYGKNQFSAALVNFKQVRDAYPAHRLAASYIIASQAAIDAGKNERQLPPTVLIAGAIATFLLGGVSVCLIIRHHGKHQLHKVFSADQLASSSTGRDSAAAPQAHHVH